jgi:hypothetical protein
MKKLIKFFAFSIFVLSLASCNDDDENVSPVITNFTASMIMGSNEVPPNNSTATGSATLRFNNTTKVFTVTVVHNLVAPTGGHIHKGAAGTNGDVVLPFTTLISPIIYTSPALTAQQEADLMANLYYINLHTAAFAGGEIRGQLIKG